MNNNENNYYYDPYFFKKEPPNEKQKLRKEISEKEKRIKELLNKIDEYKTKINDLSSKNNELSGQLKSRKDENINLKTELSKFKNEANSLKNLLVDKDKDIEKIKLEPDRLKKENKDLSKNNIQQKDEIINKAREIAQLKEVNIKLKQENEAKEKNYVTLSNKYKKLEEEKNNVEEKVDNLNKKLKELQDNNMNLKELEEKMRKINENEDKSLKYENLKKENFYDIIIKCNSILALKNGWEISMTDEGKKKYFEYKDSKFTKIGVIGSENRGKSTILSDFSKIELPTGASITTEGLSIKYPDLGEFKNRKIILLDSAGLETPILKTENINPNEESQQDNNEEKKPIKMENGGEEIKHGNKKENVHAIFENKSRDIIQLELFLQNFIIKYSDILILILGKLTINEQKLLLKVNSHIKNLNRKEPLIVIHNLKEFTTRKQVNNYLENILKKSSTFSLEENNEINLEKEEESGWKPLFEPKSEPKIYHLIYAKKGSEAGDFYNQKTINFIYKIVSSGTDIESFDPIECVKSYFSEISETILENPIGKQELVYNQDITNEGKNNANDITKIMLKDPNKSIILKKCLIDELGFIQGNSFNAQYSYYITEKNLFVYVELPGKYSDSEKDIEYENVEIEAEPEGSYYVVKITGTKKNCTKHITEDKILTPINKRQFGAFTIDIKLDKINLDDDYDTKIENGTLLIKFNIKKKGIKKKI